MPAIPRDGGLFLVDGLPDKRVGPVDVPMWLVAHRDLNTSARVRAVFDFLALELSRRRV